jgi:hypothetical protein
MTKIICIVLCIVFIIIPFIPWTISIVKSVQFSRNCLDYLTLAADANSVDIAEKHLTSALDYLEANGLTEGKTHILISSPTKDIGIWYENLKSAQTQLRELKEKENLTEMEESNALMKLRETLLNSNGTVSYPENISLYPNHIPLFWLNATLWLLWILALVCGIVAYENDWPRRKEKYNPNYSSDFIF